jgi:hypothetical protein
VLDDLDPGGVRPALWFSATRGLLHATRGVTGPDRQRLDAWIAGDPVLSLYAALKRGDL